MSLGETFDSTSLADFSMALESIAIVKCNLSTAHKIDNHHYKRNYEEQELAGREIHWKKETSQIISGPFLPQK